MKDFFISYSTFDEQWAEWVAWEIEELGYSVILQKWDFSPGVNFAIEMNDAVQYSKKVVLILSKSFLLSDFTQPEWTIFFSRDPRGKNKKIIPIRVDECKPTGLLSNIVYIDFVGHPSEHCKNKLRDGISIKRAKPINSPDFPSEKLPFSSPIFPSIENSSDNIKTGQDRDLEYDQLLPIISGDKLASRYFGRTFIRNYLDNYISGMVNGGYGNLRNQLFISVFDIDGMSGINKRFGPEVGDSMLEVLWLVCKTNEYVNLSSRMGDDAIFALIIGHSIENVTEISEGIVLEFMNYEWPGLASELFATCSGGIAKFKEYENANSTVSRAAQGLRAAQKLGGSKAVIGPDYIDRGKAYAWRYLTS